MINADLNFGRQYPSKINPMNSDFLVSLLNYNNLKPIVLLDNDLMLILASNVMKSN